MASLSFPVLPPPVVTPLQVGAVAAVAPVALLQAEAEGLPLPLPGAQPAPAPAAAGDAPDGAAMRPDQLMMARQLSWPSPDGGALASAWRGMVRNYGAQLVDRDARAREGQLPPALLLGAPSGAADPRVLRQADFLNAPPDAWRFTVHARGSQEQHLRVVEKEPQPESDAQRQPRRRPRAALRLELVLADGSIVTVQAEPAADGVLLELCAPDHSTIEKLRGLQPELEAAVRRAGLRVLGWTYHAMLPGGRVHARLPSYEAASALSLPVFRAMAELALLLPASAAPSRA